MTGLCVWFQTLPNQVRPTTPAAPAPATQHVRTGVIYIYKRFCITATKLSHRLGQRFSTSPQTKQSCTAESTADTELGQAGPSQCLRSPSAVQHGSTHEQIPGADTGGGTSGDLFQAKQWQ